MQLDLDDVIKYLAVEKKDYTEAMQIQILEDYIHEMIPILERYETLELSRRDISGKYNDLIDEYNYLVDLYKTENDQRIKLETIMKEKAKRARKLPKDHTGYICRGVREVSEKYSVFDSYTHRTSHYTATAYRATLQSPYYSEYGFSEIRRLMINDIVNRELGETVSIPHPDSLAHAMGIDYVIGSMAADGTYPDTKSEKNFLYRAVINLGKEYAEIDLYTTAPPRLLANPYKPVKNKAQTE